jgi:predicted permease
MTRGGWLRRVLRAMLWLYPAEFRHGLGADAVDTHVDRYRDGRRGRGGVAFIAIVDLLSSAPLEWAAAVRGMWPARLRFVLRALTHRPGVPAVIVVTLALGIGANTAIFSLIDAVLLRPVPVADPASLVAIYRITDAAAGPIVPADSGVPFPVYRDLQPRIRALAGLAAWHDADVALAVGGRGSIAQVATVSGNYFQVLGVPPVLGRAIEPRDDETPLASPVVVLSDGLWAREFNRDSGVLGQTLQLGPTAFTIVGVAPAGFRGTHLTRTPEAWVPMTMMQGLDLGGMFSGRFSGNLFTTFRGLGWLHLVGRLQPGVAPAAAEADLSRVLAEIEPRTGSAPPRQMAVAPLSAGAAMAERRNLVAFIGLLGGLVALILLLACVSAAHLLLVRGGERVRELGICAALGAGRGRLMATLLLESACLAAAACVASIVVGLGVVRLLATFTLPGAIDIGALDLSLDWRVLAFAIGVASGTVLVFGLIPAIRASRVDPVRAFRDGSRGATTRGARGGLIAAQIAISLVILIGAGLFVRSLRAGLTTDLGFDPEPIASATVELRLHGYDTTRARTFYLDVVDALSRQPGIAAAALTTTVPPAPTLASPLTAADAPGQAEPVRATRSFISPGYFRTLGVPIVAGRTFTAEDRPGSPRVAIVNEAAARALSPDGQAVGRRFLELTEREYTIVGVARDTAVETLTDLGTPHVYYAILQEVVSGKVHVLARAAEPTRAAGAIREAGAAAGPEVAVVDARPLTDQIGGLLMPQRFGSVLLGFFGALAAAIAAIGIYATVAAAVADRRAEIGIRIALGAARRDVYCLVAGRSSLAALAGVGLGLAVAGFAAHLVERFLFGTQPVDPAAFAGATAPLLALAGLASWLAARRALRIPPIHAIRAE